MQQLRESEEFSSATRIALVKHSHRGPQTTLGRAEKEAETNPLHSSTSQKHLSSPSARRTDQNKNMAQDDMGWVRVGSSTRDDEREAADATRELASGAATHSLSPSGAVFALGTSPVCFQGWAHMLKAAKGRQALARGNKGDQRQWARKFIRLTRDGCLAHFTTFMFNSQSGLEAERQAEGVIHLSEVTQIHLESEASLAPWASEEQRARDRARAAGAAESDAAAAERLANGGDNTERQWAVVQLMSSDATLVLALPSVSWLALRREIEGLGHGQDKMVALERKAVDRQGYLFTPKKKGMGWKRRWIRLQGTTFSVFLDDSADVPKQVLVLVRILCVLLRQGHGACCLWLQ